MTLLVLALATELHDCNLFLFFAKCRSGRFLATINDSVGTRINIISGKSRYPGGSSQPSYKRKHQSLWQPCHVLKTNSCLHKNETKNEKRTKIFFFPRQGGKSESSLRRQQQKKASDLKVGHEAAAMASNERKAKQKLEQIFWRYQVAFKIIHETYYYFYQKPKNLFRLMPWKYFFLFN